MNELLQNLTEIINPASTDILYIAQASTSYTSSRIQYSNLISVTLTNAATLTNKVIDGNSNTLTVLAGSQLSGTVAVAHGGTGVTSSTGTGSVVLSSSPTLVTPTLGVASATSVNKVAITAPASSATLTIANSKTLTVNNTMTLAAGADSQTFTFPSSSTTLAGLDIVQVYTARNTFAQVVQTNTAYSPAGAGTATLDLSLGNLFTVTVPAGNITMALSNGVAGQCFLVRFINDTSIRTITWFTTIKWPGGSAPALSGTSGHVDTFGFIITGTNTYDGYIVGEALS